MLIELTPGPNMGYLAVVAASAGRRAGFAATGGVAVGLLITGIASLSVFPAFIDDDRPLLAQTAILLAVYVGIATIIHSVVVFLADGIRPTLENQGKCYDYQAGDVRFTGFGRGVSSVHDTKRDILISRACSGGRL